MTEPHHEPRHEPRREPRLDTRRWKPTRAGIRNIWEYDEQVFSFADGRMILRGPNGSGKSNALALIFPFLFDGTMSAAAMDPFAGGRSMKSLLLGVLRDDARSGFRHDQRLGYVWLEFTRSDSDMEQYLTVGCGARARTDSDSRSWFFITDRRVGVNLDLAPGATPLTRQQLLEELGAEAVFDSAEGYRQAVARDLLGIESEQLTKLNSLIRALRRPHLAGKLNVEELSAVLSSGLPAVAPSALDDIAASLDDLERVQQELVGVRDALSTVDAFLPTYRAYIGGEARRRASEALGRERQLGEERRSLARLEKRKAELSLRDDELQRTRTLVLSQGSEAVAERDALKDSERFKGAQELEREQDYALTLKSSGVAAAKLRDDAIAQAERLEDRAVQTARQADESEAEADRGLRDTMDRADRVRATWSLDVDAQNDAQQLRSGVDVMVRERRDSVSVLRRAVRAFDTAVQQHHTAEAARSKADEARDQTAARLRERTEEQDRLNRELDREVANWLAGAPGLDDEQVSVLATLVAQVAGGEYISLSQRYQLAVSSYRDSKRDELGQIERALQEREARRVEVQRERDDVAGEKEPGPIAPPWRAAQRSGRAGAPLWACCDFASDADLSSDERSGIEAALEGAGLLDAWLQPDGEMGDGVDTWLRPSAHQRSDKEASDTTLLSVLSADVPEGSGLTEVQVEAVLASVQLGEVGIAIAKDGRFILGPLAGRCIKPEAEFIGATARAQRRARRLRELDHDLALVGGELIKLAEERVRVDAELVALVDSANNAPELRALFDAAMSVQTAQQQLHDASDRAEESAAREATAAAAVAAVSAERDSESSRLGVPANDADLDRFDKQIEDLSDFGRDAAQRRSRATELRDLAVQQHHDAQGARSTARERAEQAQAADQQAKAQHLRVDTLRRRLGADVGAVFDEVAALGERIKELDKKAEGLGSEIAQNRELIGGAIAEASTARSRIDDAERHLRSAGARLPVLRGHEILNILKLPTDDLPLDPVEFAGWIVDQLGGGPDDKVHEQAKRAVDRAQKQLLDDLHHGYAPAIAHDDDVILVEVTSDDRSTFGLAELRDRLERQVSDMEQHLTDSDREIFERHLLNRVSHELRRLLGEADEFIRGVNAALARTKTASGLQVELRWVPTGDDGDTRQALELLRRDTDHMGDDDRGVLRRFFDLAIKRQRAEDPDAGYRSNLEQVVDYRRWHRFEPYLVGPDGRAKLTRERFRGLSGGEQAVALHLPLFAAAAAHYDRADSGAPRLVALDEAFAGIDEEMRGELMGLTVAFDLDVLLTGHEIWGAYSEVPAIAVHDLLRRPPLVGVSVLTMRWDGHVLSEDVAEQSQEALRSLSVPSTGLFAGDSDQ